MHSRSLLNPLHCLKTQDSVRFVANCVYAGAPAVAPRNCYRVPRALRDDALVDRRHPRDLYDLFRFSKTDLKHNPEILRKVAVLFGSTMDRDFRTYTMDRSDAIDPKDVERVVRRILLRPLNIERAGR